jgi:branched-chain amino acid transport system permease protein
MDFFFVQIFNALAYSTLLYVMAVGLSLVFGLLRFTNLAHGSFYMFGAYLGWWIAVRTNFAAGVLVVAIVAFAVGCALERFVLRRFYARGELDQVLITLGIALAATDASRMIWGGDVHSLAPPAGLDGTIAAFGASLPVYRIALIVVGAAIALAAYVIVDRTQLGARIRAGVADNETLSGLGVDVPRMRTIVFGIGVGLAAIGGVLSAPMSGVYPGMDFDILITALIVVVLGGLGSLPGALWGALIVGTVDTFGKVLIPGFASFLIFSLMAVVLLVRAYRVRASGAAR